jgi:hypothetical protein
VAETLVSRYANLFGTEQMVKIGKRAGQNYTAEEVRKIRQDMPPKISRRFALKGETRSEMNTTCGDNYFSRLRKQADISRRLRERAEQVFEDSSYDSYERMVRDVEYEKAEAREREASKKNPASYPVDDFLAVCREAAFTQTHEATERPETLENLLRELCLDPGPPLHSDPPWYFFKWDAALQRYM